MLQAERAPVRVEGARGPLSPAESQRVLDDLRRKSPASGILERHVAIEEAIAGSPLTIGNRATLLEDGPATYREMLAAIRGARHHVHMESYIFEDDEVGAEFARAFVERRKAGVAVRLVVDGVGSIRTRKEFLQGLADQDVEVAIFRPVDVGSVLTRGAELQKRNHRKLLVVDGRVAFLGGINVSGVYTAEGVSKQRGGAAGSAGASDKPFNERPWRDTQVKLEGPVVEDFQKSFVKMWAKVTGEKPLDGADLYSKGGNVGPHLVRAIEGSPSQQGANAMYLALVSAIDSAEQEITITMAYFVPHDALLDALKAAAARGVKVRILLPSRTDNWLVLAAGQSYYGELLESGVRLFERKNRLLHSKTATIDGVWSTVGSTNLDWRSLAYNDEINAVILGPEFAAQLGRSFEADLKNSVEITREAWEKRPVTDRAKEGIARAWARML